MECVCVFVFVRCGREIVSGAAVAHKKATLRQSFANWAASHVHNHFIWIIWIKIQSNKIFFCVIEGTFFPIWCDACRQTAVFVCLFDFVELVKVVAHKISLSKRTELQIIATKYIINTKHVNHFEEIMNKMSGKQAEKVNKNSHELQNEW